MEFKTIFYEADIFNYDLGRQLKNKFPKADWIEIENHNNIEQLRQKQNTEFAAMKKLLVVGIRKTHTYRKNQKVSDFLVPTKFSMVETLLNPERRGRTIARMSVNPPQIIADIEKGTSNLTARIRGLNLLCDAGYKTGLLIALVVMVDNWRAQYAELLDILAATLSEKVKKELVIEVIFMTYSYIHRAINNESSPVALG